MHRALRSVVLVAVIAGLLAGEAIAAGRSTYRGEIDGAKYRVEVPDRWNGALVLHSHGYYAEGFQGEIALTNSPHTETWLLEHGYALAASDYKGRTGYAVETALEDQIALHDWFVAHVGRPRRTIATGHSMGAPIAILLAERNPRRFAGVSTMCGGPDPNGTFNAGLDIAFTVKTLLAPGQAIDLVRPADPAGSAQALARAVAEAAQTPQGRARLALAGAFNNVPGWSAAHVPRPTDLTAWIRQQADWLYFTYSLLFGPIGRADLERRAGGNPSWNIGIDYRRQLARSSQTGLVREAYRQAGLDLREDLDRLAAAPRIAPDPGAVRYMYRYGVPRGTTPAPIVTLHATGDGGAVPDQERWYAEQVRRNGDAHRLRQLYVERGAHCANSAAEEIVALRTLEARVDTGRWPDTDPRRLNAEANEFGAPYHDVQDFGTGQNGPLAPAFTRYVPPRAMRPSR